MRIEKDEVSNELRQIKRANAEIIDQYSLMITDETSGDTLHRRSLELPQRLSAGSYLIQVLRRQPESEKSEIVNAYGMTIDEPDTPPQPTPPPAATNDLSELMRMIAQQSQDQRQIIDKLMEDRSNLVERLVSVSHTVAEEKVELFKKNNEVLTEQFSKMAEKVREAIPAEPVRHAEPVNIAAERRAELIDRGLTFGEKLLTNLPGILDRVIEVRAGGGLAP